MLGDQSGVTVDKGRVVRLFGERAVRRCKVATPKSDWRPETAERTRFAEVRARLDDALERRLVDPALSIAANARLLMYQERPPPSDALLAITEAAARMDAMSRDLLRFVRIATGDVAASRERIDLDVLCERVVDAIGASHPDRAIIFRANRRVAGDWDPDALEILLSKLVLNAIEHGRPSPAIRVCVYRCAGAAIIEVWNAGVIADTAVGARLFEPFVSGPSSGNGAPSGLGLGLYLAREIARVHGGGIEVQSDERAGTTFRATLPSR